MIQFIHRLVPLEASVKAGGDGMTVEAYAAVFDSPAEIRDHQGHYQETIDRAAFDRAITRAKPQSGRDYWLTKVFYNHGMTLHGTPSERGSVPVATTTHIEADSRGLLTVSRYIADDPFSQQILGGIKAGSITSQSFTGQIIRSDPNLAPRRQHARTRAGELPTVRRLELGLTEYGPTPVPAYANAEVVGVRSFYNFLPPAPDGEVDITDEDSDLAETAPSNEDRAAETDSPEAVVGRSVRPNDQFQRRLQVALRARGIS